MFYRTKRHKHSLIGSLMGKSIAACLLLLALFVDISWAGPPFRTDDPEPADYKHGELYIAGQYEKDRDATSGTAPHLEFNYGVAPDIMLHLITPYVFNKQNGETAKHGYGDTELGVKYRFINDEDAHFMVGTFPLVELPTGDSDKGLGAGHTMYFIPIWLQKSWGPWQTYGGGGFWKNPGAGNKDYWFFGWQVQRELNKRLTLGTELFSQTKTSDEGLSRTGFTAGAIVNLSDGHHLLFSTGCDIHGENRLSAYAAYQYTFGRHEDKKE